MANRCTLHRSHLAEFREWLARRCWTEDLKLGQWQVLRAIPPDGDRKRMIVFYDSMNPEHLTATKDGERLVELFIKQRKTVRASEPLP